MNDITGLTVAVTGPTGQLGTAVVDELEQTEAVGRILGMARRPFDPAARGWRKTEYRRGDIRDRAAVAELVANADVVVHLAFVILGSHRQSHLVNLLGSRNVFEAAAGARRLIYASSLAAYGYHSGNPVPLTEDVPAIGSNEHYYSRQKAACEALLTEVTRNSPALETYVLRPCVVAGPNATLLADGIRMLPSLPPLLADPGVPFQLVHHDDVAAAVRAAVVGAGPPGAYNLAAEGQVTVSDLARALGGFAVPVPQAMVRLGSSLLRMAPWQPARAEWIHAMRCPMLMDTSKARHDLGWSPGYTAAETLAAMATAVRAGPVIDPGPDTVRGQ